MEQREAAAKPIVTKYIYWSMGAGLIPVPFVDLAAVSAAQIKMLYDLAKHYDVPFSKGRVKSLVGALVGGVIPTQVGAGVMSLTKAVPFLGTAAGIITVPVLAGASTYALGKVFIQHFESGGTFLDFNPTEVRQYFEQHLESGKTVAREMAKEMKQSVGTAVGNSAVAEHELDHEPVGAVK